jgi:hypothetical protein|tara:strand:+ start:122 stop:544 length:423 start_codon:yes stop_codon:yes gene_type:complete
MDFSQQEEQEEEVNKEFYEQALKIAREVHEKDHKDESFKIELVKEESIADVIPKKEIVHDEHNDPMYGQKFEPQGTFSCTCGWKKPVAQLLEDAQQSGYTIKGYNEESDGHMDVDKQPGYAANKADSTSDKVAYNKKLYN